jgi:hypothetical protein
MGERRTGDGRPSSVRGFRYREVERSQEKQTGRPGVPKEPPLSTPKSSPGSPRLRGARHQEAVEIRETVDPATGVAAASRREGHRVRRSRQPKAQAPFYRGVPRRFQLQNSLAGGDCSYGLS